MFERYTERARRVIFFARYETSMVGSPTIETEHLLLGLIREDAGLISKFAPGVTAEGFREQVKSKLQSRGKISTSIDLPLSDTCQLVLKHAARESESLRHLIDTGHLLLGLLSESGCLAEQLLREIGIHADAVRERLAREPAPSEVPDPEIGSHVAADTLTERILHRLLRFMPHPADVARLRRDAEGKIRDGRLSSSREEDGVTIVETHHFVAGRQISLTERISTAEDGKTLRYSMEIVGPRPEQQHRYSMEFDAS